MTCPMLLVNNLMTERNRRWDYKKGNERATGLPSNPSKQESTEEKKKLKIDIPWFSMTDFTDIHDFSSLYIHI